MHIVILKVSRQGDIIVINMYVAIAITISYIARS